jgi:hypothetical protein
MKHRFILFEISRISQASSMASLMHHSRWMLLYVFETIEGMCIIFARLSTFGRWWIWKECFSGVPVLL